MKKTLSLLLSLVLMLSLALPASAAETEYPTLEGGVTEIQKYGNIVLDIDPADLKDGRLHIRRPADRHRQRHWV